MVVVGHIHVLVYKHTHVQYMIKAYSDTNTCSERIMHLAPAMIWAGYYPLGVCCVNVFPSLNYTTFENSTSLFTFSCSGVGTFLFWIVDGNVSTSPTILQRGIQTIPLLPSGGYVYSLLSIPTNMENNNSEVVCKVFDYTGTDVQYSHQLYLRLQGKITHV